MGGNVRCLPRAMALQWMLRSRAIPSRLVVAIAPAAGPGTPDPHHAWTEAGGTVLVGDCDRSAYRALMVFDQGQPAQDGMPDEF